jgi:ABC-type phosphate transport system substrate-binding protein
MSGHDGRRDLEPHHARNRIISAGAAAITVLALSACTSTATTSKCHHLAASGRHHGHWCRCQRLRPTLTGAGSTFGAPFVDLAFARYHHQILE